MSEVESREVTILRAHFTSELHKKQKQLDVSQERLKQKNAKVEALTVCIRHTAEVEESKKYLRYFIWVLSLVLVWYVS